MINQATSPIAAAATRLTIADLNCAEEAFASLDAAILALCDNSFVTPDITSGDERFCHQLRHVSNADTVYLCCRRQLSVTTTTSAANDVENEDTQAIHRALTESIADLDCCENAVSLPSLHVFPDHAAMAISIVPVSPQTLAVIVDPDDPYRQISLYSADAIASVYRCLTATAHEGFAPSVHQIQKFVLDELNRTYQPPSQRHTEYRFELFKDDLTALGVTFEKLIEPQPTGNPVQWGWQAVPLHAATHTTFEQLSITAESRPTEFTTALDLCVMHKTTETYKSICESAQIQKFDDILPMCLPVALASLQQTEFIDALRQIIEKRVIAGSHLVFEVRDTTAHRIADNAMNTVESLIQSLHSLKQELGIRYLLSDSVLKNASLTTLLALEPDFIKFDHFVSKAGVQPVGTLLSEFSLLAETGVRNRQEISQASNATELSRTTDTKPTETEHVALSN